MSAPAASKNKTGIVAIFTDGEALKKAAEKIRDAKVKDWDCFTPFPIHGLEHAMGIKPSKLPWVTFGAGLTGLATAFALETWVAAIQWPLNVGGKPYFSFPAFIPVMFELTVLFAGLATAFTMIAWCGMPNMKAQIFDKDITNDKFALFVSDSDANFRGSEFTTMLKSAGAIDVRQVK